MKLKNKPQRAITAGLAGLVLTGLILAACGGAATPSIEGSTTATEAEDAVDTATEAGTSAEEQPAASAEEVVTEATEAVSEATDNKNLLAPDQELSPSGTATCQSATPQNDPLAAALQPNELVATVSDGDWSKGPADAPVTLIEYGDFQ